MAKQGNLIFLSEGKSKRIYSDGDWIYLEFKGDVSTSAYATVFDERVAALRTKMTSEFFRLLSKQMSGIAYTEPISRTWLKMEPAKALPLEWIPRFVAAGSVVKRFGFKTGHVFTRPVLKIDYKTKQEDFLINDDLILEKGILSPELLKQGRELALNIAKYLKDYSSIKGLNLWDFKMELGIDYDGRVKLIDEISLDGMRIKDSTTGKSFDKDVFRETGDIELVIKAYEEGIQRLFGNE